jgi:serine/threonine protein kinase
MAPEMALGNSLDGRADLYALGCVAYYLLTGKQVFDGNTAIEIMSKHLQASPVPPSERSPFTIPRQFRRTLGPVLRSCREAHCIACPASAIFSSGPAEWAVARSPARQPGRGLL